MFSNYLAAALRNLARNRLYAGINIIGLAVGFAAAILIALFVRDELTYDRWIPGYENVYRISATDERPGQPPTEIAVIADDYAAALKLDFPFIESVTRMASNGNAPGFRRGERESTELNFWWADTTIFDVLPLPFIAGDPKTALSRPDGIVLTRSMARKYFGRDTPLGETIEIERNHTMTVTGILEDLPSDTHLAIEALGSNLAPFSAPSQYQTQNLPRGARRTHTYVRLPSGAAADELRRGLAAFIDLHRAPRLASDGLGQMTLFLQPIAGIHLRPNVYLSMKRAPGDATTIAAISAVGVLIVLIAGINFVNLMTARATRRAVEVGVRKSVGAKRFDLMLQFIGETLVYMALSTAVALGLVQLLLPTFDAFLDRTIVFDWFDPMLVGGIVAVALFFGIAAGVYPATILSAFRPANVLKGGIIQASGSAVARQALVLTQFAILIGLIVASTIFFRQTNYALNNGLRLNTDQVVMVGTSFGKCDGALKDRIQSLPGVRLAACSLTNLIAGPMTAALGPDGSQFSISSTPIDFDYLELYGLKPVAGRFFEKKRGADAAAADVNAPEPPVVINETAMHRLGFSSPSAAIGKTLSWKRYLQPAPNGVAPEMRQAEIIGVAPDYPTDTVRHPIAPLVFSVDERFFDIINVKLTGRQIPETLHAIEQLWKEIGEPKAIVLRFLDQNIQMMYADITRQSRLFGVFSGVTLFVACLGLFGLSAFTAERRRKEVGIRKAMGARRHDIVRLLAWQFAKPVLLANLIAWPVTYYFMNQWLHGFAYHVDLAPWIFLGAGLVALVIALLTISGLTYRAAGAPPIQALRHE